MIIKIYSCYQCLGIPFYCRLPIVISYNFQAYIYLCYVLLYLKLDLLFFSALVMRTLRQLPVNSDLIKLSIKYLIFYQISEGAFYGLCCWARDEFQFNSTFMNIFDEILFQTHADIFKKKKNPIIIIPSSLKRMLFSPKSKFAE